MSLCIAKNSSRILEKFTWQNKPNENTTSVFAKVIRQALKNLPSNNTSRFLFLPVSHQVSATEQNSSKLLEPDHLTISIQFSDILPKENELIALQQQNLRSSR